MIRAILLLLIFAAPLYGSDLTRDGKVYKCTVGAENDEVVIGDENDPEFPSKVKMTKWGEDSLTFRYDAVKGTDTLVNGKVSVEKAGKKQKTHIYKKNVDEIEFEIILDEKPASNVFTFQVEGWESFDFYHQPPLTPEEIANGNERPENVIDSYAVYHKTKKHNKYKTGKAIHIYRIKAIDDYLNETWAESFVIENGVATIVIPQTFLDTAHYPVRIDPTLGNLTLGASLFTGTATTLRTSVSTGTAATDGTLSKVYVGVGTLGTGVKSVDVGLYTNASGVAGTLVASVTSWTPQPTNYQASAWYNTTITGNVSGSTTYWPAWNGGAYMRMAYDAAGAADTMAGQTLGTLPETFTDGGNVTATFSIYFEYTETAPPATSTGNWIPKAMWWNYGR